MQSRTVFTSCAEGDLSVLRPGMALDVRRHQIAPFPWTWLHQVHGARVVSVDRPGAGAGERADAAVTACAGAVLAVSTADCAPLVLAAQGAVGVAHVGWRGLMAGVVEATVVALRALAGSEPIRAALGPCIRARCYEFGSSDLAAVPARYGPEVRGTSRTGSPALDLPAGITVALERSGVPAPADTGLCTACSPAHWSFRAEQASARQAAVAWLEP